VHAGFKTSGPVCPACDGCELYAAQFCGPGGDNPVAPWELFGDNSAGGFLSADEPCGLILAPPDPADTNFAVLTGVDPFTRSNPGLKQTFEVRTNNVAAGGHAQGSAISAFGFDDPTHYSFGSIVFTYDGTTPSFHSKIKLRIGYRNGGGSVFVTESDWFDFNLGLGTDDGDQGSVAVLCAQPSGDEDGSWSVDFSFLGQQIRGTIPAPVGIHAGVGAGSFSFIFQNYRLDILDFDAGCVCHPPPEIYDYGYGAACDGCGGDVSNTPPFLVASIESTGAGTNDAFFWDVADCSALLRSWSLTRYAPWDFAGYCVYRLIDGTRSPIWTFDGGGQVSYPDDLFAPGCGLQTSLGYTAPPYSTVREATAAFAGRALETSYYPLPNGFGPHPLDLVEVQDWCSKTSQPAYAGNVPPAFPGGHNTFAALLSEGVTHAPYSYRYRFYAFPLAAGFRTVFPGPSAPQGFITLALMQLRIRKIVTDLPDSPAKLDVIVQTLAGLTVFAPEAQDCLDMDMDTSILSDDDLEHYQGANDRFWCDLVHARGRLHT
jgi:hypothetical protein